MSIKPIKSPEAELLDKIEKLNKENEAFKKSNKLLENRILKLEKLYSKLLTETKRANSNQRSLKDSINSLNSQIANLSQAKRQTPWFK